MFFKIFENNSNDYDKGYKSMISDLDRYSWENPELVKGLIQPAVEIITKENNKIEIGKSKIGGTPDLPDHIEWPKYEQHSMVFFAQINLSDLSTYHRDELLPKTGMIYFFSYFPEPENEFGAAYDFIRNRNTYETIYFDGDVKELKNTKFPSDLYSEYHFNIQEIKFRTFFHMPPSLDKSIIENSNISETDKNQLQEYTDSFSDGLISQILGMPVPLQSGVDYDFSMAYLGLSYSDEEKQRDNINKERDQFINLLTIPIFDRIGDSQCYFGIHKKDLMNKDFKNTVFVMQGT